MGPTENERGGSQPWEETKEQKKDAVAGDVSDCSPPFPPADQPSSCVSTPTGIRSSSTSLGTTWASSQATARTS